MYRSEEVHPELLARADMAMNALERYRQSRNPEILDEAAAAWERLFRLPGFSNPQLAFRVWALREAGQTYSFRYAERGNIEDLNRAVALWDQAVNQTPVGSPDRIDCQNRLGIGLRRRYSRTGDPEDLKRAISAWEGAVAQAPPGSADLPLFLNNLGNGLWSFYGRTGEPAYLEEAIRVFEQAISQTPAGSPDLPGRLNNFATGLMDRYERSGEIADLEQALQVSQQAVNQTSAGSPDRPGYLNNLGLALRYSYLWTGEISYLEQAIATWEDALAQSVPGSAGQLLRLTNLGVGLWDRYSQSGELTDLERTIQVWERVVDQSPAGSPDLPGNLNNLGAGLRALYKRTKQTADLERSIQSLERAVKLTLPSSPNLPVHLNNLGNGLRELYISAGEIGHLQQAISAYRRASEQTPPGSPNHANHLNNLASGLNDRYERMGEMADLEEVIRISEQVIAETPPGSPNLPSYLSNLGTGLSYRYAQTGEPADLERAAQSYQQATINGLDMALEDSLYSARVWGDWAFTRRAWPESAQAYDYANQAVERLLRIQPVRHNKETWLKETQGIPTRAAYAFARDGNLPKAVAALEQGIARLLANVLERERVDLEALRESDPDLCRRYRQAAVELGRLELKELRPEILPANSGLADEIRSARADLDTAIEKIRLLPGFENFLRPRTFADIQTAAEVAPLVYVIATEAGGLALILRSGHDIPITALWLADLTEGELQLQAQSYLNAYFQKDQDQDAWFDALESLTGWLWRSAMGEIVEALAPAPMAVLIPVGLLGLFPLHAAWTDKPGAPTGKRYALDDVTLTYAPNGLALQSARQTAARSRADSILAVGEPRPTNGPSLPHSQDEVQVAVSTFPIHRNLSHEEATREAALAAVHDYQALHFCCHGFADFLEPLSSGLVMAEDQVISLHDLLDQRLEGARLAILSACETGIPGTELPNEVASLPTGMLHAGVAGVVASLWSVTDISATTLMARFYELWRIEGMEPAQALRQAQLWMRDTNNGHKSEHFKGFLPELGGNSRMGHEAASSLYQAFALRPSRERSHAHPYYWAAFGYVGA